VKQVKEKNEENESGNYQYVVRGPPWERKVVKVKVKKQDGGEEQHSQFPFLFSLAWPLSLQS
jgi:hypothetical protein